MGWVEGLWLDRAAGGSATKPGVEIEQKKNEGKKKEKKKRKEKLKSMWPKAHAA
jgi:hypothetical protein